MFICPYLLTLCILSSFRDWRRGVGNLGQQVSCGRLRDTVDEHPDEGDASEEIEPQTEAEQDTLAVSEPIAFLVLGEVHTRKIGDKKFSHQTSRREVGLQEYDEIPSR